ncbi:MAG: DUF302 domain-containing protein [Hyphomicrobiaceae bacterium]
MACAASRFVGPLAAAIMMTALPVVPTPAASAEALEVLESRFPVKETLDRLAAELQKRGIKVAARIDHAAGAKAAGLALPPTEVLIFGNPKLGTPLMQASPTVAIDLPMKVLAWQGADGKVRVGYTAPQSLARRHGIDGRDEIVATMSKALAGLTKAAAGN